MVAFPSFPTMSLAAMTPGRLPRWPLPVAGAVAAGGVSALAAILMPGSVLESLVVASGLPAVLAVAEPPLGLTARALLALAGGGVAAAVAWSALYLLVGPDGLLSPRKVDEQAAVRRRNAPTLRRADAHPDAPPRWPLMARDLGPPMPPPAEPIFSPEPEMERPLPADLETPLAAVDPASILAAPMEPVRPVPPLAPRPPEMAPGERLEVFPLTPMTRGPSSTRPVPASPPTIAALLERLEKGVARREPSERAGAPSLEETLGSLRQLAMRR